MVVGHRRRKFGLSPRPLFLATGAQACPLTSVCLSLLFSKMGSHEVWMRCLCGKLTLSPEMPVLPTLTLPPCSVPRQTLQLQGLPVGTLGQGPKGLGLSFPICKWGGQ